MKISELIKRLEDIKKKDGDLTVRFWASSDSPGNEEENIIIQDDPYASYGKKEKAVLLYAPM